MTTSLYGLSVDYTNRHGHFMVLSAPGGLREEALSSFHVRMLTGNRMPGLLEVQLEGSNGEMLLHYAITGKRMLTQSMRVEKLSLQTYYRLLLRIAEILRDSAVNMLEPGRYILHEDFMYTGSGLGDLFLTYVPVRELPGKQDPAGDLLSLASRWIQGVSELQGSGFQELMRYLQDGAFSMEGLCSLLQRLIAQLGDSGAAGRTGEVCVGIPQGTFSTAEACGSSGAYSAGAGKGQFSQGSFSRDGAEAWSAGPAGITGLPPAGGEPIRGDHRSGAGSSTYTGQALPDWLGGGSTAAAQPLTFDGATTSSDLEKEEADGAGRKPLYVILAAVLACAMIWKVYAGSPGETRLYICSGLTVVTAYAALAMIRKLRRGGEGEESVRAAGTLPADFAAELPGSRQQTERDAEAASFFSRIGLGAVPGAPAVEWAAPRDTYPIGGSTAYAPQAASAMPGSHSSEWDLGAVGSVHASEQPAPASADYSLSERFPALGESPLPPSPGQAAASPWNRDLALRTTLLQPPDATVFLGSVRSSAAPAPAPAPYLEWTREGMPERMVLQGERFVIGRAEGEADGLLTVAGVSRLHAELLRDEAGVISIKDLGSRNGTAVNGEALVPYRQQPLRAGDRISIAAADLVLVVPA